MTKAKREPNRIVCNFLRSLMTDVNSSRSGQWIFPDFPRAESLGDAQFPRIGITLLSDTAERMGISDDTHHHIVLMQIDCIAKKDQLHTLTVTDEALGTMASDSNSDRMVYDFVPKTVTNIKHNTVAYGTVNAKNTDSAFTAPGSLSADTVEYSISTGNVNFSSADVSGDDGEAITSTYDVALEGEKLSKYLARQVIKTIRNNWRTDSTFNGLFNPIIISNSTVPLDQELGIFRQTVELQCRIYNIGEGL